MLYVFLWSYIVCPNGITMTACWHYHVLFFILFFSHSEFDLIFLFFCLCLCQCQHLSPDIWDFLLLFYWKIDVVNDHESLNLPHHILDNVCILYIFHSLFKFYFIHYNLHHYRIYIFFFFKRRNLRNSSFEFWFGFNHNVKYFCTEFY